MNIKVDNKILQARKGEMLLAVLRRSGIRVPTLCHMADRFPTGACRMCVVEVDGQRKLLPSCATAVSEGMTVQTHSPRVLRARKTIVELLLANHPDDCLYCVRNRSCELQGLCEELGVRERRYAGEQSRHKIDSSSASLIRDPAKCILCGRCVRVCEEVQGVSAIDFIGRGSRARVGTAFDQGLNVSSCIHCGQCILVCPTGALREQSHIKEVLNAINDPEMFVVVQHAPSVSVTLGEELRLSPGKDLSGLLTAALRRLGFDRVFDTGFAADLTVMEEASELVARIQGGGPLPMMTSCSPGWVKFVEEFYPEFIPNLSTCKSPQQMMGAVIKNYFAAQQGLEAPKVFSVAIMPCTAKKFECQRPEMREGGLADVDAVLTTRELARVLQMKGLDLAAMHPEGADTPFGERSTAGKLFGAAGGVMEAALRTAHWIVTGRELGAMEMKELRGFKGVKQARVLLGEKELGVAAVSGLANARQVLEELRGGRQDLHVIEVMTCPGGCIAGGGQPGGADAEKVRMRMKALYRIDHEESMRTAHANAAVQRLYREFMVRPNSAKSHQFLHTKYGKREVVL